MAQPAASSAAQGTDRAAALACRGALACGGTAAARKGARGWRGADPRGWTRSRDVAGEATDDRGGGDARAGDVPMGQRTGGRTGRAVSVVSLRAGSEHPGTFVPGDYGCGLRRIRHAVPVRVVAALSLGVVRNRAGA